MKTKFNKDSRNLLISLLLGDGSINKQNAFRLLHGYQQKEYIEWKLSKLSQYGIKHNGLKESISLTGYSVGNKYYYTRLAVIPFIKVLKRVLYRPKKKIANIKLLNRIDSLGLAIWYMDDGHINIRKTKGKVHGFYIRLSVCLPKEEAQVLINYFEKKWGISFYTFKEGKGTFSLCCGTKEGIKFIEIVRKHVEEVPSMMYKISYDLSQRTRRVESSDSKWKDSQVE